MSPLTWEQYVSAQELPDECPVITKKGKACGKPWHPSPKVRPFCCVFHRNYYVKRQSKEAEDLCVSTLAGPCDIVANEGRNCRVLASFTSAMSGNGSARYHTTWQMCCGSHVDYPKALPQGALLTCIECLAHDGG